MVTMPHENPSCAVEVLDNLNYEKRENNAEIELFDLRNRIMDLKNVEKDEMNSMVRSMKEQQYVVLGDNGSKIEKINVEEFKKDVDYEKKFTPPSEYDNKKEVIRKFAEWMARNEEMVKTVKLGPKRGSKEIWSYNKEESVWNKEGENRVVEKLYDDIRNFHSKHNEKETINKVKKIKPISIEETGPEEGEIAVSNGILNLETKELRDIQKQDYVLNKLPVKYIEESDNPEKFLEFLEDVVSGEKDVKKIQEFLGYCLMNQTAKYEKALMILGPTDSGKSVFLNVVRELLGEDNIAQESLQNLTNGRQWGLANVVDKLANIDHDLDAEKLNDIGTAKKVISGNPMSIEEKHKQPYEYAPTAKHLFSANKTPPRDKEDDAFYNRWLTVTFPRSVPSEEQDPNLTDKLTDKEELQRILKWSVEGAQRLEENKGFSGEKGPEETKMVWREWGNSSDQFIEKYLNTRLHLKNRDDLDKEDIDEMDLRVHTSTLYNLYEKYASGMDMEVKSMNAFSPKIRELPGVEKTQVRIGGDTRRGYRGLKPIEDCSKKIEEEIQDYQDRKY